jgi:hypothetical protein
VLIAPPGRTVGSVARSQIAAQTAALPNGDDAMALYDAAIARFAAGEPVAPDPSLPPGVLALLGGLAAPANLPFTRELWMADGRTHITFVFPENANRVLKHEPKPRSELSSAHVVTRYNGADAALDEDAMTSIVQWLIAHTS